MFKSKLGFYTKVVGGLVFAGAVSYPQRRIKLTANLCYNSYIEGRGGETIHRGLFFY
jgi:hypothetical protein